MLLKPFNKTLNKFIHCLESLKTTPVMAIIKLDHLIREFRLTSDPVSPGRLIRVEVFRPRDLGVWEEMLMSLCGFGKIHTKEVVRDWHVIVWPFDGVEDRAVNIAVWCDGRNAEEEWFTGCDGVVEEAVGLAGYQVGRVFTEVILGLFVVSLEGCVPVVIRVGVQEEILMVLAQALREADVVH